MHLPCPSCGTTYDIDLSTYTPGTIFECIQCQTRVSVPGAPEPPPPPPPPTPATRTDAPESVTLETTEQEEITGATMVPPEASEVAEVAKANEVSEPPKASEAAAELETPDDDIFEIDFDFDEEIDLNDFSGMVSDDSSPPAPESLPEDAALDPTKTISDAKPPETTDTAIPLSLEDTPLDPTKTISDAKPPEIEIPPLEEESAPKFELPPLDGEATAPDTAPKFEIPPLDGETSPQVEPTPGPTPTSNEATTPEDEAPLALSEATAPRAGHAVNEISFDSADSDNGALKLGTGYDPTKDDGTTKVTSQSTVGGLEFGGGLDLAPLTVAGRDQSEEDKEAAAKKEAGPAVAIPELPDLGEDDLIDDSSAEQSLLGGGGQGGEAPLLGGGTVSPKALSALPELPASLPELPSTHLRGAAAKAAEVAATKRPPPPLTIKQQTTISAAIAILTIGSVAFLHLTAAPSEDLLEGSAPMALNTPVAENKPEAPLVKAPKDKAEAPSAPAPKDPAAAPTPITQATLDSLNYDELLLEAEQRADTPDAQEEILPWIQLRLAMHYGHEKSKAALEAQADSALELLKSATSEAPPSATKLASALGTLVAAKRTSSINSNLHRQNALKMSGIEGARYAYVAGLALPPGKKHSQRLLELLDHALKEHPVFPDALLTKAEHLFKRNRIGAATKALETFSDQNHPDEALLRMAALLLPRKLYATLSPIAETVNLDALGERVHPSLVKTSKEIKRYQDVLNGNFLPLIEETRSAINESQDALQSVLQLARLQNAANDPFMANQTLLEYRTELAGKDHGRLTYEMIQVQLQARAPDIEAAKEKLVQFKLDANRDSEAWVSIANGDYALHKNQYKTALRYYKEAQQVKGDLPILSLKLNLTKAKSSQRPPDLARLTKLAKSSGLTEVNLAIARGQEATGNFEEAKSLYEIILWTDPLVISPLTLVTEFAWLVHQQGDSERAIAIATALHLEHPTFVPLIKTLIKMEASEEQSAKWTTVLNTLQPENPNDTIQMAKTWLDLDDPEKARTVIMRLLDEKPQARTAKLTRQLARTWASYDDVKARALLLEALRDEPSADTYILLAELKTRQGNPEHALAAYREALEMAPDLITTRFTLVELLKKEGQLDEAITHLEIIKKQEPDNPLAHELLGDTYLEQGEHQKALDAFTQAMEVSEPTEKLLLKSARLELYELNQIKHAVKNFERVLQINPEHAETHYMLGFALKDLDQFERAKLEFAAYLRITPDGEHTQEVEEALAELEKKPQELK